MINKKTLSGILFTAVLLLNLHGQTLDHLVQRGDTFYSLSKKYGVSIDDIMKQNGFTSTNQLKTGNIIQIPQINLDYNGNNWYIKSSEYYVEKGDTFYSISRSNGMSVAELLRINNLSEDHVLHVGERLVLKSDSAEQGPARPVESRPEETRPVISEPQSSSLYWPANGTRHRMDGKLQGVRITADAYSYVRSIASGKVVLAEPYRGFGNVILIDVNGYIYLYGGNEDIFVNVGEEVAAGTRIGRLGMSDKENGGKDMYFSVFKDGKPVDTNTAPRG